MLEQYWQEIVAIGTPAIGFIIMGGIKYIKNKLASNVVSSTITKIKGELGAEDYNALIGIVKNVGVRKAVKGVTEVLNQLKQVTDVVPLIVAMSQNHLSLGVYDESPELKEIVERTLDNVK